MRAIRIYSFNIKKTAKFSALPAIVHEYLEREGLTVGRFLYCLEAIDHEADARDTVERLRNAGKDAEANLMFSDPYYKKYLAEKTVSPCERAVKDCPKLGPVKKLESSKEVNMYNKLQVSNIIDDTDCTEADIAPFIKRYERTYGMMDTNFFYYDIDFFGKTTAFLRDRSKLNSNLFLVSDAPALSHQVYGSGICISRTALGETVLELSIDVLHDGVFYDPEPYYRSMCDLLPGAKCRSRLRVFLTEEEKTEIAMLSEQAQSVLEECRSYLNEKLPSKDKQTLSMPNYNIAPLLKKLAKKAGYSYSYEPYGFYALAKRLPRGHFLKLDIISGPSHYDTTLNLTIEGLGFSHSLVTVMETPSNQDELDAWLGYVFDVLTGFEKKYGASLDSLYKPTPDWFKDAE